MEITLHLNISVFPMVLLAVIYTSMRRNAIRTTEQRLLGELVISTFVLLLIELITWVINGLPSRFMHIASWVMNLSYFLLVPVIPLIWLSYIYFHVSKKFLFKEFAGWKLLMTIPLLIYMTLLISTPWTGILFTIDSSNLYTRGAMFFMPNVLCMLYMLMTFALEIKASFGVKNRYEWMQNFKLAMFTAVPIIASIVQAAVPQIWIALPCTAIAELLVYIFRQRQLIKKDALTGLNNRGCLDAFLYSQFEQEDRRYSLCLFMLDLDNFKSINDTYGHDAGDKALIRAASVLTELLHGTDAFLARYGGDEFCIVKRCDSENEAREMLVCIKHAFEKANTEYKQDYALSCSAGYSILGSDPDATPEKLIRRADDMLYIDKKGQGAV